ncbi:MAG: hypothetical protein QOG65_888, partial [Actinomycetota bacterium]|nr:hypothetical protein [Actinomycetota bacterium]
MSAGRRSAGPDGQVIASGDRGPE